MRVTGRILRGAGANRRLRRWGRDDHGKSRGPGKAAQL